MRCCDRDTGVHGPFASHSLATVGRHSPEHAMSLRVMSWAWSVYLSPTPKLVLMALADEADDDGYCFPSQRRLASKCSITDRTVRRVLLELTTRRHVRLEVRRRVDGSRTSNGYRLACGAPPDKLSGGMDTHVRGPRTTVSGGADTDVLPLPTTYPLSNPTPQPREAPREARNDATRDVGRGRDFEFPEGVSAGQVEVLRDVLSELQASQVQQVLDELAGRMKVDRITNPIRYCVALARRIERGQFTPELGIRIAERRAAERQYSEQKSVHAMIDRATLDATIKRLPDDLRASLERMRRRTHEQLSRAPPERQADDKS